MIIFNGEAKLSYLVMADSEYIQFSENVQEATMEGVLRCTTDELSHAVYILNRLCAVVC